VASLHQAAAGKSPRMAANEYNSIDRQSVNIKILFPIITKKAQRK
jgi:hypothetical protein